MGLYDDKVFAVTVLSGGSELISRDELFKLFEANVSTYYGMTRDEILALREGYLRSGGARTDGPENIRKNMEEIVADANSYKRFKEGVYKQMRAQEKWDREHRVDYDANQ